MADGFLLDLIFPKRCVGCSKLGSYFCENCQKTIETVENQHCLVCGRIAFTGKTHPVCQKKYTIDGSISVFLFDGLARSAIHKIKYRQNYDLVDGLIDLLLQNFWKIQASFSKESILIPVPLAKRRLAWRGFNQAELIARALNNKIGLNYDPNILTKTTETRPQVELKGRQRQQNVFRVFEVADQNKVKDKDFVLVDDMRTTGATLKNCAYVLKKAGAKSVWGLTIARTASKLS